MNQGKDFKKGKIENRPDFVIITPTNCRVAIKGFEPWVQKVVVQLYLQAFPYKRNLAHQYKCGLPFAYALGQRLSYNHAHCRGKWL